MQVKYKDIEGFPGYRVGSDGSVWSSLQRIKGHGPGFRIPGGEWNRLKERVMKHGYVQYNLCRAGEIANRFAHTLVLEHFCCKRPDGKHGMHKDNNPGNNAINNLKWGTRQENADHRSATTGYGTAAKGEGNGRHKLTEVQVREIRDRCRRGESDGSIAKRYPVSKTHIGYIRNGRSWSWLK